ncbi:type II CAAX endopeptidase family protein [Pseudokineococcus basanitobsidens]|uniref:Type II CAAX endopeptidase family protein n=1 Tax=Pseudokineococcus basanitobsidens TaxID=1926649 RepID=A0ABU8RFX3_9ACTN
MVVPEPPVDAGRPLRGTPPAPRPSAPERSRLRLEVFLVLALSLGASAVYAVVSLVGTLTRGPLREATATLNASRSDRPWFDLTYQLLATATALVPVVLALALLGWSRGWTPRAAARSLGFDLRRPGRDLLQGLGLAALIGVPGLGLYLAGRALGVTADVDPAALDTYWWTVPVLLLSAVKNGVLEEVVVVGWLLRRLHDLRWGPVAAIAASALLRGSYHLYQGVGPFVGNAVMGVVFALVYRRTGRVMPLVVAHTLIDAVAFVGYAAVRPYL